MLKAFYGVRAWVSLKDSKLASNPLCEECLRRGMLIAATIVHHVKPVRDFPDLRLDFDNLESNCASCHSRHHAAKEE